MLRYYNKILTTMILKRLLLGLCAAVSIGLTGCSSYALINSESFNTPVSKEVKTFRIVDGSVGHLPPGMTMVTYYNIAAAIREQMTERGYTEDPVSPILVNFGVSVHKELETEPLLPPNYFTCPYTPPYAPGPYPGYYPYFTYPRSYYWNYYSNAQVVTGIYKEGVLTIDIVDVPQKMPLFTSSVATIMNPSNNNFVSLQGVNEAVTSAFSKFPVAILPQYKSQK